MKNILMRNKNIGIISQMKRLYKEMVSWLNLLRNSYISGKEHHMNQEYNVVGIILRKSICVNIVTNQLNVEELQVTRVYILKKESVVS